MINEVRKIIYICSPYRGRTAANISWAKFYCKQVLKFGHTPIAPHVFYTEYLDDAKPSALAEGLVVGISLLRCCDEVWVFGNCVSEGMAAEILEAQRLLIPVRQIRIFSSFMVRAVRQEISSVRLRIEKWRHGNGKVASSLHCRFEIL